MNTARLLNSRATTIILLLTLAAAAAVVALVLGRAAGQPAGPRIVQGYAGTVYDPPQPLSAFTMPGSTGEPVSLSDLAGRWALVFFGYTHCPDFCPLELAEFKQIKAQLGDQADEVQFVFVSVDGQRDTPEALARYLSAFDSTFIGLSGDDETLARIQPEFGLFYERRTDTGSQAEYLVDHSTRTYLIDRESRLRVTYPFDTEPEAITESIRQHLAAEGA